MVMQRGERCALPASRKTRGLLAYLALAQRPCRRDELCDLLWDGASDPRGELRWSLAKIKLAIGAWLDVSQDGVALVSKSLCVDGVSFRALAREPLSQQNIAKALALWRGTPLADVEVGGQQSFQAWLAAERETLAGLRTNLLKAAVDLAWTHPEDALCAARRLVAAEPWNEWGHARVVQLLERCGRVCEATDYAAATRRRLACELGVADALLLMPPPPPPLAERVECGQPALTLALARSEHRPTVKLEPLKLVPRGDDAAALGLRVAANLNTALWRSGACIVLDGETTGLPAMNGMAEAGFALRGAVARGTDSAQVSLRCIDVRCGAVVWSGQVELEEACASAVQEWVEQAVEAITVAVRSAGTEADRADSLDVRIATAKRFAAALEPAANRRALTLLNDILAEDADAPCALALAAWCHAQRVVYNWSDDLGRDKAEARYFAASATRAGMNNPACLTAIATARTLVGDRNEAEVLLERSLQLDGRLPEARVRSGWLANYAEQPREAARHFRAAIRLAPIDPSLFNALAGLGVAHFIEGNHVQAIRRMEQALALNPKAVWIYRNLVPAYAAAGERQKAESGVCALLENYPRLSVGDVTDAMVFSAPVMAKIASGLRGAGLSG
ncbi:hypothetical protein GCM10027093_34440 [Paraburkholderia jirisanensis]